MEFKISVVVPVLNEEKTIMKLLNCLSAQTLIPNEVIIVDGGSVDRTVEIISGYTETNYSIILKKLSRAFPGRGRNCGVEASRGSIVVFTDAGCCPDERWLEELAKPFKDDLLTDVVFGKCCPLPTTSMEKVISLLTIPRTNWRTVVSMALRREIWNKSGGFPENEKTGEDVAFIHNIERLNVKIKCNNLAINYWFPRSTLRLLFWQFYNYAKGQVYNNLNHHFFIRKSCFYLFLFFLLIMGVFDIFFIILLFFCLLIWSGLSLYKHSRGYPDMKLKFWEYFFIFPVIIVRDVASIIGYFIGLSNKLFKKADLI